MRDKCHTMGKFINISGMSMSNCIKLRDLQAYFIILQDDKILDKKIFEALKTLQKSDLRTLDIWVLLTLAFHDKFQCNKETNQSWKGAQ